MRAAALEILAENGFAGATIEKICQRAQVPRATFYRRWGSVYEAVADAFHDAFYFRDLTATGDAVSDLVAFLMSMVALYNDPVMGPCLSLMMPETRVRPELLERTREDFIARRARNRAFVQSAMEMGRIEAPLDPDLVVDVLSGLAFNSSATRRKVTQEAAETIVRRLLLLER